MLRSLVSLLLFAGLNTGATISPIAVQTFDVSELLTVHRIPMKQNGAIEPVIEADAALVMDADTGVILYKKKQQ